MTKDSTNPKTGIWNENLTAPVYVEVIETVADPKGDRVAVRCGIYGPRGDIFEVARLIVPADVAGQIGGSLLSSFGGKP